MKNLITLGLFFLAINGFSQSAEQQIKTLQAENDSLKLLLRKCQYERLDLKLEDLLISEHIPFKEKTKTILQKFSEENRPKVVDIIEKTDSLVAYLDEVKAEMTRRTGGIFYAPNEKGDKLGVEIKNSSKWGKPVGYRDKKIGNLVLLEEGKGEKIKEKMVLFRQECINIVESDSSFVDNFQIDIDETYAQKHGQTWAVYNFKNIPLAAIYPIFAKFKNDVEQTLLITLAYLLEKE